jgi:hypothetical protein
MVSIDEGVKFLNSWSSRSRRINAKVVSSNAILGFDFVGDISADAERVVVSDGIGNRLQLEYRGIKTCNWARWNEVGFRLDDLTSVSLMLIAEKEQ